MSEMELKNLIKEYENLGTFKATELTLDDANCEHWVQLTVDPQRFIPSIFDGNWAYPSKHPVAGSIRILRIVKGNDGVARILGRQGKAIYAYPWIA